MKGKSLIGENLDLAYKTWRGCGQNVEQTIRVLNNKHGFFLSRPTLYEWAEKYDWKNRAALAETEEQKVKDPELSGVEKMLSSLISSQQRYERYLDSLGVMGVDHQAQYAYNNLLETIVNIRQKTAAHKSELFIEFMRELINWLSKNDPDAVKAIEKNLDDFIVYAREMYGKR